MRSLVNAQTRILSGVLVGAMSALLLPALSAEAVTVGAVPGRALGNPSNVLGTRAAQVADINGDGKADVFAYRASDLSWRVSYSGTSTWTTVAYGAIDPDRTWLADMNGDGRSDLFTHRATDNAWLVSYGAVSDWQVLAHGYVDPSVTRLGDMTGDGKADVFTVAADGRWLLSNGGTNSWETINGSAIPAASTYLGDLDGDGREDVVAIYGDGSWRVSYSGTSPWQVINNGFLDPAFTQLVDMNGDGRADIFSKFSDGSWRVSHSGTAGWQVVNNGDLEPARTWLADMDGNGSIDVFTVQNFTQWLASSGGTGAWSVLNNGLLPVDEDIELELTGSDGLFDVEDDAPLPPTAYLQNGRAPWCTSTGWRHEVMSWTRTFQPTETFAYANKTNQASSFSFSASKSMTTDWRIGSSVTGSLKAGIFAEVSGTVSVDISESESYSTSFGGTHTVKPRHEVVAKIGFRRVRAVVKSYYVNASCDTTHVQTNTVVAPWAAGWQITSRKM
jgi:hypothetical protein